MAQTRLIGKVVGEDGRPASISIGSVRTVEPDQPARVINTSNSTSNLVLDFEIPKGRAGLPGVGENGRDGVDGEKGERGLPGRAATLKINSIEMLPEGSEPEVESLGNETDAEYVLKIPLGSGAPPEDAFIENSENPVQSKVIQEALAEKADASSVPTKVSDLENDSSFISSSTVEGMIQDAVDGVVSATNPVDDALSDVSENAVQNAVITEEFGKKVEMSVSDLNDENETKIGETVTLRDANRELSIDLRGQEAIAATLTTTIAGRQPTIVATLPATGDETILYLVPVEGNNYSMHIWMDVAGTMQYVSVSGGDGKQQNALSGKIVKAQISVSGNYSKGDRLFIATSFVLSATDGYEAAIFAGQTESSGDNNLYIHSCNCTIIRDVCYISVTATAKQNISTSYTNNFNIFVLLIKGVEGETEDVTIRTPYVYNY